MKHLSLFVALVLLTVLGVAVLSASNARTTGNPNTATLVPANLGNLSVVNHARLTDSDVSGVKPTGKSSARQVKSLKSFTADQIHPVPEVKSISGAPLSGAYTIPSAAYPFIGAAVADLNANGVSGDVTFTLTSAAYYENPITFGAYTGAATYKVSFVPAAGVYTTINFTSYAVNGKGFAFVGAQNITFDGTGGGILLQYGPTSVYPSADGFGSTIYITGGCDKLTFKNMHIKGQVNNAVWANQTDGRSAIFVFTADADPSYSTNLTFDADTVTGATYGFKVLPQSAAVSVAGLTITNCRLGGAYGDPLVMGGFYEYPGVVTYKNNIIDGVHMRQTYWYNGTTEFEDDVAFGVGSILYNLGQVTSGHFIVTDGSTFENNIIRNIDDGDAAVSDGILTYATRVYDGNLGLKIPSLFANNVIYGIGNKGGAGNQVAGVRGPVGKFYHNSIRLSGAVASGAITTCVNGVTTAYNNALSNEYTGPSASSRRGVTAGGTYDYNAIYSTGYFVSGNSTAGAAVAAGVNVHGVFAPINFNSDLSLPTAPSAAEDMGKAGLPIVTDITGAAVDTSAAGTRDAGAYQFSTGGPMFGPDVMVAAITSPIAAVPTNLAQTPVVRIKNNANAAVSAPFNVTLTEPGMSYSQIVAVPSLGAQASLDVTFPAWTPTAAGPYTFTASIAVPGDVNAANDLVTKGVTAQAPLAITTSRLWNWNTNADGWTASTGPGTVTDWVLSSTFTKLGGPYDGKSWVTQRPNDASTYTEGAYANTQGYSSTYPGTNILESQWLDLSGMAGTDVYVSFFQSINTEPTWDAAWWEYTTDGIHWKHLGKLNDPNGINWYSESVYQNAKPLDPTEGNGPDTATMHLYNLINTRYDLTQWGWWTSNGSGSPTGPNGYVFNQLHITPTTYPDIIHAPVIKFRYIAFSDAATAFAGWAIDDFFIGTSGTVLAGGALQGKVFTDVLGTGTDTTQAGVAGAKIYVSYFGGLKDSVVTDANGYYAWNLSANANLPGVYNLYCKQPGMAFTVPYNATGIADLNHPSDGSTMHQMFGVYNGSISGTVFSDVNDNGAKDGGEPGLTNYTVEVHKDSVKGALIGTAITPAGGAYTIPVPPGTFAVKVLFAHTDSLKSRQTLPVPVPGDYTTTISGTSGSPTAIVTGDDFGIFLYAILTTAAYVDYNGNGVKDPADNATLPGGVREVFHFYKVGGGIDVYDTLGNADLTSKAHPNLDLGTYVVKHVGAAPTGWLRTFDPDSVAITVATSGLTQTVYGLDFKLNTVSGVVYVDLDGNGAKNGAEVGTAGVTVNLTGAGGGTTVTDANGQYSFAGVAGGSHTLSEVLPTGWSAIEGAPGSVTFTLNSANFAGGNPVKNFGNWHNTVISGVVYRDRNNNGVQNLPIDNGIAGIVVTTSQSDTVVTDANGAFAFSVVPKGGVLAETLFVATPAGYAMTEPLAPYTLTLASGGTFTGQSFGFYQKADTSKFTTYTATSLEDAACAKVKAAVPVKVGKPKTVKNYLNMANVLTKAGTIQVGVTGVAKGGAPWLSAAKLADLYKTLCDKSTRHTGVARGFDLTIKGKPLSGMLKSLSPVLKNDHLVRELVALKVNLALSSGNFTPNGLGALKYFDPGNPYDGMTIDQIASAADVAVSNWGGVTYGTYVALDSIAGKINGAFAGTFVYDTASFDAAATVKLPGNSTVEGVSFLKSNPGVPAVNRWVAGDNSVPTVYSLKQNYPNPFNPTTYIGFDIPKSSIVTVKVYNMLGQEVATLIDHQSFDPGSQEVSFDASTLASGVYFYRIQAESVNENGTSTGAMFTQVKKMVLLK